MKPMGNPLREQDLFEEDRRLTQAAAQLSEDALRKVWDNPDDSEYDRNLEAET